MEEKKIIAAADIIVLRSKDGSPEVLLVKRKYPPYEDLWALPGGIVEPKEEVQTTAQRELLEETNLAVKRADLHFVDYFDAPHRDPRGRAISFAFTVALADEQAQAQAGDDAAAVHWFQLNDLPPLAFDHRSIIARCRE